MNQAEKARAFAAYHKAGDPLILVNAWDAGSAKAVAEGGAKAIATGSWSMAAAQGFPDGEAIPFDWVERIVGRIAATIDLPLTVDFEGGYADDAARIAANVERIIKVGVIGINFEDGLVGKGVLRDTASQCRRIESIRERAVKLGSELFINARTDLFLNAKAADHAALCLEAIARARAYQDAGATGFFVPGLIDETLIEKICTAVSLPVNVMMMSGAPSISQLTARGVRRISYGPMPYIQSMAHLKAMTVSAR